MGALKLQQFRYNLKKIFFSAQYFLCFLGQLTVPPPQGGGLQKGGGVTSTAKVRQNDSQMGLPCAAII